MLEGTLPIQELGDILASLPTWETAASGRSLDLVIGAVVFAGLVRGLLRGGIQQIGAIGGALAGLKVGSTHMEVAGRIVQEEISLWEGMAPYAGFIAVFLGCYFGSVALSALLQKGVRSLGLGIVDRVAGGAIGAIKALVVSSLLLTGAAYFDLPDEKVRDSSKWYEAVSEVTPVAWEFVEEKVWNGRQVVGLEGQLKKLRESLGN